MIDTATQADELQRLTGQVRTLRLDVSNLLAAGRAILTAQLDGESDLCMRRIASVALASRVALPAVRP